MSRHNSGSGDQHHQRAAEMQNSPGHAHVVAEVSREKQDHLTGHEQSRLALAQQAQVHPENARQGTDAHAEVHVLAHRLWEARGCPLGSPDQDWFEAVKQHHQG